MTQVQKTLSNIGNVRFSPCLRCSPWISLAMVIASVVLTSCSTKTLDHERPSTTGVSEDEANAVVEDNQPPAEKTVQADAAQSDVSQNAPQLEDKSRPDNSQPDNSQPDNQQDSRDLIDTVGFVLPSGNIYCITYDEVLRCQIESLLNPIPPQPQTCELDWGSGIVLARDGDPEVLCAGDTIAGNYDTLTYGNIWRNGSFECKSEAVGLTCHNATDRGFFLSRERWEFF